MREEDFYTTIADEEPKKEYPDNAVMALMEVFPDSIHKDCIKNETQIREDRLDMMLAELISSLQVPISMSMPLGKAREVFVEFKDELGLTGWFSSLEIYEAIKKHKNKV